MSERAGDPGGLSELQRRIAKAARDRQQPAGRVQVTVGQVVVAQLLPAGVVKGGAGLKLRLGDTFTRDSRDLDTTMRDGVDEFIDSLSTRLVTGWGNFTGQVVPGTPPTPAGVPAGYVTRPFAVKLRYRHKPFMTVELEVGYDELDMLGGPVQEHLADDIVVLFRELGLPEPNPVRLLPVPLQIAQKLHACSAPGSERAHDLVDLQLLVPQAVDVDVATAARRLFAYRRAHPFPTAVAVGEMWDVRYKDAAEGLGVLPDVAAAVTWVNEYITRLASLPS